MTAKLRGNGVGGLLALLGWLVLIPALLLSAFLFVSENGALYGVLQDQYVNEATTGVSDEDRYRLNEGLAAFLRGEREQLDLRATVYGVEQEAFHADERAHMDDVLALFDLARKVRWYSLLSGVLLVAASVALTKANRLDQLRRGYGAALALWGVVLLALAAWAASDFNQAFLRFHGLLFQNDLWIMNPATDLMIRMLPEAFFRDVALIALIAMLAVLLAVLLVLLPWCRWMRALRLRNEELERREALKED